MPADCIMAPRNHIPDTHVSCVARRFLVAVNFSALKIKTGDRSSFFTPLPFMVCFPGEEETLAFSSSTATAAACVDVSSPAPPFFLKELRYCTEGSALS